MPRMLPDGIENEDQPFFNARVIEEVRRIWIAINGANDGGDAPDGSSTPDPNVVLPSDLALQDQNIIVGNPSGSGEPLPPPSGEAGSMNWDGSSVSWTEKWGYSVASGYIECGDDVAVRGGSSFILTGGSSGGSLAAASSGQGYGIMYSMGRLCLFLMGFQALHLMEFLTTPQAQHLRLVSLQSSARLICQPNGRSTM